jgi:superkiller protein 3
MLTELELAARWSTPCILLAVYGSEYVRSEAESLIEDQLTELGQEVVHIHLKTGQSSLFEYLNTARVNDGIVFFIDGLRWGQSDDAKFFGSLNHRREIFKQDCLRLILWVTQEELLDLVRFAADLWASRDRMIEFLETPTPAQVIKQALDSAWQAASEMPPQPEHLVEKIALDESLLAAFPADDATGPNRAGLLLTLGLLSWRKGEFTQADEQLGKALQIAQRAGDNALEAECLNALALLRGSMDRVEEAIQAYKQAIRLTPGRMLAWSHLGSLCSRAGRNDEAIVAFLKAIECNAQDGVAWNGLGAAYHRIGYSEDACTAFQKAIQYMPTLALPWNGLGDVYAADGRLEEAVHAYQRAIDLNRDSILPWLGLGGLFARQDRWRDAVRAYQRALGIEPESSSTWDALGQVYLKSGAWQDAEDAFLKAVELAPESGSASAGLAGALSHQARFLEAIPLLLRSVDLCSAAPDKASAWELLGDIYRQLDDYENAMTAYHMADSLVPGITPARMLIPPAEPVSESDPEPEAAPADLHSAEPPSPLASAGIPEPPAAPEGPAPEQQPTAGDSGASDAPYWIFEHVSSSPAPETAVQTTAPAADDPPSHETGGAPMPDLESLNFAGRSRDPLAAGLLAPDAPDLDRPQDASPFAWNEKGNIHFKQGDFEQAISAYNQAIEIDPAFGWPYSNLALCYFALGQHAQAIQFYQKSIELLGTDADRAVSWNGLGNVYRAMGNYPNAVAAYQRAGDLDPRNAGMREGAQTLQVGPGLESAQVMNDLGEIFLKSGVYTEAINAFNRAIALDPSFGWSYSNLARTLAMLGQHAQAIPLYQKSIELMADKKDQAVSWNRLGNSYRRLNDYDNAIKAFREAVALNDEGVNLVTRARFSLLSNCCVD